MKYNRQLLNSTWGIAIWKGPIANLSFLHFLKTNVQPIHILVSASFDGCSYHDTKTIQNKQWYPMVSHGIPWYPMVSLRQQSYHPSILCYRFVHLTLGHLCRKLLTQRPSIRLPSVSASRGSVANSGTVQHLGRCERLHCEAGLTTHWPNYVY